MLQRRADFPFYCSHTEQSLVYLDNAATTQLPEAVIGVMDQFYRLGRTNVHRGLYPRAEQVTQDYEQVRATVAAAIGAQSPTEIVFTKGTTEAVNLFATAWGARHLTADSVVVVTQAEHHANLVPWQEAVQRVGARLVVLPMTQETYCFDAVMAQLPDTITLLAVTHDSNVLGPVWGPDDRYLTELLAAAGARGATILLDAAQSIAHGGLDVKALGVDAAVFSGHKMYGPTGVGVLYVNQALHESLMPYQYGGGMVHQVTNDHATYAPMPHRLEAGTPPIAQVLGLGAALAYLASLDRKALVAHEAALCNLLLDGLLQDPTIVVLGDKAELRARGHLVSFAVPGLHAHDLAALCGDAGVAVRAGHHCAQPLAQALGHESLVRISIGLYNNQDDIVRAVAAVHKAIAMLKKLG